MSAVLLTHVQAFGKDGATSLGIDTTGASLLVIHAAYDSTVAPTVSDSKGNTWHPLTEATQIGAIKGRLYYAWNPIVGSGHTFTVSGAGSYAAFQAAAYAGIITSSDPYDGQSTASIGTGVTSCGIGSSSITPTTSLGLVVTGVGLNPTSTGFKGLNGFTLVDYVAMGAGSNYGSGLIYETVSSNATISNATTVASWDTALPQVAVNTALFKADSSYTPPTPTVPGPPTNVVATKGDGSASVAFSAPGSSGNSAILDYTVTSSPGNITATGAVSPINVPGLTNGVAYTFTVHARNAIGNSVESAASNSVTPASAPPTVTGVTINPNGANLTKGQNQLFAGTVQGTGAYTTTVTWSGTAAAYLDSTTSNNVTFTSASAPVGSYTLTATASDGTHTQSVTIVVAAVQTIITPATSSKSYQPMTRVVDSSTTTGTGTLTLGGTTAAGCRTISAAYVTAKSRIPYVAETADKAQWESGVGTFTPGSPSTFSRDQVFSSSNAGAPVSFTAATTIYCDIPAEIFTLFAVKDYIDLRDFDVDPTFTVDSTAGIQAAIQKAWDTRTSKIKCPDGRFKIAAAPTVSGAQLWIPNSKSSDQNRTILFEGASPPNLELQGLVVMPVTTNGTIFESTYAATTGTPSLLRGEAGNSSDTVGGVWNYTNVGFKNMGFRTKVDTGANPMTALNLGYFSQVVEMDNLRIDVNMPIINCPDPTVVNSSGLILPGIDNHANYKGGMVLVAGFANGVMGSEHMQFYKISAIGCGNALVLEGANHGSAVTHLHVECCKNSIVTPGNHPLGVVTYSTEHNSDGHWFNFNSDINCTGTPTRKIAIMSSTVVVSHQGVNDAGWAANNASSYRVLVGAGANAGLT